MEKEVKINLILTKSDIIYRYKRVAFSKFSIKIYSEYH